MRINPHNFLTIFVIVYGMIRLFSIVKKREFSARRELCKGIFAFYLAGIVAVTLFPVDLPPGPASTGIQQFTNWELFNFLTEGSEKVNKLNIAGNICLFIPFMTLFQMNFQMKIPFLRYCVLSIAASGFIELMQLLENVTQLCGVSFRIVDINDILFNFTGAVIGYMIWEIYRRVA